MRIVILLSAMLLSVILLINRLMDLLADQPALKKLLLVKGSDGTVFVDPI